MKTRIKIVKHGDGKIVYYAQTKLNFKDRLSEAFWDSPIAFIMILPVVLLVCFIISKTTWSNLRIVDNANAVVVDFGHSILGEHYSMEGAKRAIDLFVLNNQAELEMKLAQKKAKKVVSKTYLKYP